MNPEFIHIENRQRKFPVNIEQLRDALAAVMHSLDADGRELSVLLVNDPAMRRFNFEYRGIRGTTDVLSFAMGDGEFGDMSGGILGDLIISLETILRQAGQPFDDGRPQTTTGQQELALMAIHGLLHLLGYDHETSHEDASEMINEEKRLFQEHWRRFPNLISES